MINPGHGMVELLEMFSERVLRINVQRRAELFCKRFDRDAFAEQFAADITEVMHQATMGNEAAKPQFFSKKDAKKSARNMNALL